MVANKDTQSRDAVVIRFAGDSGDGMQLTGSRFTSQSALAGNDIATWPDYPAEIRAPAGTLAGVSGFQLHFSSSDIYTPGDQPSVLIAMNPAALKANLADLELGGIIIVDNEAFSPLNLQKAGYAERNPLKDDSLSAYQVFPIDVTSLTHGALADLELPTKVMARSRNLFCLGVTSWLFTRPIEPTIKWIENKFAGKPLVIEANIKALKAGYFFAETTEIFATNYEVKPAQLKPGTYRNVTGTETLSLGLMAAAKAAGRELFLGAYPITPASELLHTLAKHKKQGVVTFQAEDEIAAIGAVIGASFGGAVAVTSTSGPGLDLKAEALGLAVMTELPLVLVDVQRAGPSTGLPTKTEQSDLWLALYGRHGECPLPVLAASSAGNCFDMAYEAVRIALKYMTPVILLSDTSLANGAEPWLLPTISELKPIETNVAKESENFHPYIRNNKTLARPWMVPGVAGFEHRLGGLEKDAKSGAVSYDPINHETMTKLRAEKIERITQDIPATEIHGETSGDVLIIGWGSTFGSIRATVDRLVNNGVSAAQVHLHFINPLPADLGEIISKFKHVVVPELNNGQLVHIIRDRYLVDAKPINKIQGRPFRVQELIEQICELTESCVVDDKGIKQRKAS